MYNMNVTNQLVRTVALLQPIPAPLKEPRVEKMLARDNDGNPYLAYYVSDPYEDYVRDVGNDKATPGIFRVAMESRQLRIIEPLINGKIKVE